jgi:hypothetical protein
VTTVSPQLARLIARCLEREPGRRPPTLAAIAAELRGADALDNERVTQDVAPLARTGHDRTRRRWPIALAVAALAMTVTIVALAWPNGSSTAAPASNTVSSPSTSVTRPATVSPAQPTPQPTAASTTLAVDVHSTPPGAAILIDGKPHGTTPAHLELAGPTSIVVRRAGYRTGHVRAEHAGTLDVQLAPLPHVTHQHSHGETLD